MTAFSIGVNVLLAVGKLACGILWGSRAVSADGLHTLADVSTDLAVFVGVRYWSAPPDQCHPYGHARIESLVTVAIGVVVGLAALAFGIDALRTLFTPGHVPPRPGPAPLVAACASIIVKEGLYRRVAAAGRRWKSTALHAAAWHHRADALSSIPAAMAAGFAWIDPHLTWIDPAGAVIVAGICLNAAWSILRPAARELTERGADPAVVRRIADIVRGENGVRDVHAIRTRQMGGLLYADLHVLVDPALTVRDGHDIAERVKHRLYASGLPVADVVVHIEPWDPQGEATTTFLL